MKINNKLYSEENTESPGPWGNSPEFFCDLCININSPEEATKKFKNFLIDIVWNEKHQDLIFINSFLKTLHYDFYIWHHNGDPLKIYEELNHLNIQLEKDWFRQEFISRIQKYIIEKVSDERLGNFSSIFADYNSREIDLDEISNAVDNKDEEVWKRDQSAGRIFEKIVKKKI